MFGDGRKSFGAVSYRWKLLFSFITGAVASLIFPPFVGNWQGYGALVLFLALMLKEGSLRKRVFWLAYVFGFSFYAVGFIWINNALMIDDNQFTAYVPLVFIATGVFFGLFWGLPAVISAFGRNIYSRGVLFCCMFVLFEWIRSFIFTGFPWNLLGTALSFSPFFIQGAAYVGTYGLSFILLMLLYGLAMLLVGGGERKFYCGALGFVLLPLVFLYGVGKRYEPMEVGEFTVRLVQPSIPQTFKWHPALAYKNFREYINLSKSQPLDGVDMVVWGETATPYFLDRDEEHLAEITQAISEKGFLVTGLLRAGIENGKVVLYNSLFVIDKVGVIKDYYDKAHLVPFGEYLPFREYLPEFMTPVANVVGNLGRGVPFKSIQVEGLPLMGGAICYESIFPKEVVNFEQKPEILLVLANDGWYGVSAGPYQHLAAAQMRAVEEGITVIRSANTGISAVIYPNGDVLGNIGLNKVGVSDVQLPQKLAKDTFYGRYGNRILLVLLLVLLVLYGCLNTLRSCD